MDQSKVSAHSSINEMYAELKKQRGSTVFDKWQAQ
jgi:hypothetical protein